MTTRYFDSVLGSDTSNDGLTSSTPWQNYDAKRASIVAGDIVLTKRGTPQVITTTNMDAKSGNPGAPTIYGAYGVAQVPYSIWTNPSATGNMILNVSGRSNIVFQDMYFDGQAVCQYSLYMLASGSTPCVGNRVSRCYFTNMKSGEAGLVVGGTATSTGDVSDHIIEDSFFFNNPGHGLLLNGANSIRIRRTKFYGNGGDAPFGAHGVSCKARRTDATSGWTNTTGTVWQRTLAAYETNVYYVKTGVSPYQRLNLTAGTATAPGLGEFGVSAGVLYINVGSASDPATQSVNYAWGRCFNILFEYNESYGNFADARSPDPEGHGFAFDDYTESSIFRGNKSHNNAGAGFSVNRGDNNLLEANVAYENNLSAVSGAACKNTKIKNNTFYDNNRGTAPYDGEIVFFTYAQVDSSNNSLTRGIAARPYGFDLDLTCTHSGTKNNVYGYTQVEKNGTNLTSTTLVDPQADSNLLPQAPQLIRAGSFLGGKDLNGKGFYNPPTIGAVESAYAAQRRTFAR